MDLLRLEGFRVTGHTQADDCLTIDVEVTDRSFWPCSCQDPKVLKHGRRTVQFKDHPVQRTAVNLRIIRQRYRCSSCGTILLEHLPGIDVDHNMTVRFRDQIARDAVSRTFTDAAALNGVKESLVRRVFKEYADRQLAGYQPVLPRVLGMDEKVLQGHARFVIGDVEKRTMLDMQASRRQMDLERYFHEIGGWANVEVITQDMYWGYKTINEKFFKRATIVIDKFHVVRYANLAVEAVRKSVQNSVDNDTRVSLKRKIKLLAARTGNLSEEGKDAQKRLFKDYPVLDIAVTCKEWFYDIYECQSRTEAEKAFQAWVELLPPEMEKPFKPILSFMKQRRWKPLIFNYFDHRYTNAYVEALNGLIDQINRSGRGYNLETLRAKALLRYGEVKRVYARARPGYEHLVRSHMGHGIDLSTFEGDLAADLF
jgi:transposase